MKKDYSTKKKAAIAALSIVAVCLAGGLFYYTSTMGGQPQETPVESTAPVETQVIVPEIKPEATPKVEQAESSTSEAGASEPSKETTAPASSNTQDTTQSKPSDGKPKSPKEAVPPSSPPAETNQGSGSNSESTQKQTQPQAGEKRSDGKVYFPGFGWVEDEGENSQGTAPNAGTGEPVGDM